MKRPAKVLLFMLFALAGTARADVDQRDDLRPDPAGERMNAMVGLWYGPYNGYSFEYDLIAQFWKSHEWMGNITGPYLSDEIGTQSNRVGIGFATGKRLNEKGTFAAGATLFEQNRWGKFSNADIGAEARLSLFIFGAKLGLIENWKKLYWQVGLSY